MTAMTQDQHGQARGSGYVVRGNAGPEEQTEEYRDEQSRPMTRFQKVASALRGGSEREEHDRAEADQVAAGQASADRASADRASARQVAATGTGAADHAATEPDMFGTTRRPGEDTMPLPEGSRGSR